MQEAQQSLVLLDAQEAAGQADQAVSFEPPSVKPARPQSRLGQTPVRAWDAANVPHAPRMFSVMSGQLDQLAEELAGQSECQNAC